MTSVFASMVKNQNSADIKKSVDGGEEGGQKRKNDFNLQESIEEVLRKMKKDKGEDPAKKIPEDFDEFARSQ